jgi:hypothetical protein
MPAIAALHNVDLYANGPLGHEEPFHSLNPEETMGTAPRKPTAKSPQTDASNRLWTYL